MPTYDYKCRDCEAVFSKSFPMDDRKTPEGEPCPECEKEGTVYQCIVSTAPTVDPLNVGRLRVNSDHRNFIEKINKDYKTNLNEYGCGR